MMQNKQILFNKIPEGMPQEDTFKIEEIDTPKLESDGVYLYKRCIFQWIHI